MRRNGTGQALVALAAALMALGMHDFDTEAAEARAKRPAPSRPAPVEESDEALAAQLPASVQAERALARKPNDRAARIRAAKAHLAEGADSSSRVDAAREHAAAVLAEHPTDLEALLLAGQTSLLKNDPGGAARYYRAATLADTSNATAFLGLGDALTRLGDEEGATAAFARYRTLMGMPPLQAPAESVK